MQEAESSAAVFQNLRQQGWWPVTVVEIKANTAIFTLRNRSHLSAKDLAAFFHELATLISSGIALDRALYLLSERNGNAGVAQASGRLLAHVRDGLSLAHAISSDKIFPKIAVGLVRAGEASGTLDTELFRLSEIMARSGAIRTEITSALVYPVILLITASLAIGVIMVVVVPEFAPLFEGSGRAPPMAFQFLIGASGAIQHWGWLVILLGGLGAGLIRWLLRKPAFQQSWDAGKMRLPLVSVLLREIETARFCRTLGTLVKSDIALQAAVALASNSITNSAMSTALSGVANGLREGKSLVDRLNATRQFSPDVLDLLRVGEETGRLGDMLLRQADISEGRMRTSIARLLAIMVPAITLALGVIVAGIVTSLLVAILSINDLALS